LFGIVILANAASALAEAGLNTYLPSDPTSYLLFEHDGPFGPPASESSPQ
jgi:hypothetical protein